ncbi:hypothetical protein L2E82_39087 [Cichorium intybus]|uniref:Uncharacterized protein n=1 Tax=Cichorium intybus TaxID=13427 RepID=A0ACB9AGI0_CICIN|nr:hypothetical protein L2E82_39087 [Cichorium intybus]
MAVQRQTAASRSARPLRRLQHGVFDGFPMTMGRRSLSKLAHTPNLRTSVGQLSLGGLEGVGGVAEGVGGVAEGGHAGGVSGVAGGAGGVAGGAGGVAEGVGGVAEGGHAGGVSGVAEGAGGVAEGAGGVAGGGHGGGVSGFSGGGEQPFGVVMEVTRVKNRRFNTRRRVVLDKALGTILNALVSYKSVVVCFV